MDKPKVVEKVYRRRECGMQCRLLLFERKERERYSMKNKNNLNNLSL